MTDQEVDTSANHKSGGDADAISLLCILNAVLGCRRLIAILMLGFAIGTAIYVSRQPRLFLAQAAFIPQTDQGAGGRLSSIAAQFGLPMLSASNGAQSSSYYARLLSMRAVLAPLADATYARGDGKQGSLAELFDVHAESQSIEREIVIGRLRDVVSSSVDPETQIVQVTVATPWPNISAQIAQRALSLIRDINSENKRAIAAAEREFSQERLTEARAELDRAEKTRSDFMLRNRLYQSDPRLVQEADKLDREVQIQQQIYTTLSFGYEQARLDAMRTAPAISIVQMAGVPVLPKPRGLLTKTITGALFGLLVGVVYAVFRMLITQGERDKQEVKEFRYLMQQLKSDLRLIVSLRKPKRATR